jgi:hypothetical protein
MTFRCGCRLYGLAVPKQFSIAVVPIFENIDLRTLRKTFELVRDGPDNR